MQLFKRFAQKTKEEKDSEYAKEIASKISNPNARKKCLVDVLGILAILDYFKNKDFKCSTEKSLHTIPSILEEFSITDIYYRNYRIDIISNYNTNITKIPKSHVDFDIMADFYVIIKFSANLQDFRILGYVKPDDVIMSFHDNRFYYPDKRSPIRDLLRIILNEKKEPDDIIGKHIDCEALFLRFLENELSYSYKKTFIKHLLNCESCMKKFREFDKFHQKANQIVHYPYIIQDYLRKIENLNSKEKNIIPKRIPKISDKVPLQNAIDKIKNYIEQFKQIPKEDPVTEIHNNKEAIDLIFKDENKFDLKENLGVLFEEKKVAILILSFMIFFGGILIGIFNKKSPEEIVTLEDDGNQLVQEQYGDYSDYNPTDEENYYNFEQKDGTFYSNGYELTPIGGDSSASLPSYGVQKVSWEIPEKISKSENYIRFLQIAGKNIKLNLQNDLLMTEDIPTNKAIRVDVHFTNGGSIVGLKITKGSGSNIIDSIIEKSVFEAFSYIKPPKINTKEVDLTLLIKL